MDDTSQLINEDYMIDRIRQFKKKILEATELTGLLSITTNEILAAIDNQKTENSKDIYR